VVKVRRPYRLRRRFNGLSIEKMERAPFGQARGRLLRQQNQRKDAQCQNLSEHGKSPSSFIGDYLGFRFALNQKDREKPICAD
jgi:hypothetical protein